MRLKIPQPSLLALLCMQELLRNFFLLRAIFSSDGNIPSLFAGLMPGSQVVLRVAEEHEPGTFQLTHVSRIQPTRAHGT